MSFEDRFGELLRMPDDEPDRLDPGRIIAGAGRRRARQRAGTAAVTCAVAVVCVLSAVAVGGARDAGSGAGTVGSALTPASGVPTVPAPAAADPAAAPRLSPVRRVAPGEKLEIAAGARLWVTATEQCEEHRGPNGARAEQGEAGCRSAVGDDLDHSGPSIHGRVDTGTERVVVTGLYLGPTAARITVRHNGGEADATLVTTGGMDGWAAYYAVLPGVDPDPRRAPADPTVTAYDEDGRPLAAPARAETAQARAGNTTG